MEVSQGIVDFIVILKPQQPNIANKSKCWNGWRWRILGIKGAQARNFLFVPYPILSIEQDSKVSFACFWTASVGAVQKWQLGRPYKILGI